DIFAIKGPIRRVRPQHVLHPHGIAAGFGAWQRVRARVVLVEVPDVEDRGGHVHVAGAKVDLHRGLAAVDQAAISRELGRRGLRDDLATALSQALAARGVLQRAGVPLDVQVLDAGTTTEASAAGGQVRVARLRIAVAVLGARPRRVVLASERGYTVTSGATLA